MARKIVGWICIVLAVGGAAGASTSTEGVATSLIMAAAFLIVGLVLLLKKGKSKEAKVEAKQRKAEAKAFQEKAFSGSHATGLPLAQDAPCVVSFQPDRIAINSGGNGFNLAYNKITDMQVATNVEIQKQYVSSVGGAIGGAVLFGPLGAIVGGRAKEKTAKNIEYYFVITYKKEDSLEAVSFRLADALIAQKATRISDHYRSLLSKEKVTIDL